MGGIPSASATQLNLNKDYPSNKVGFFGQSL